MGWIRVPHDVARRHPLYGIRGWAAVLAVVLAITTVMMIVSALASGAPEAAIRERPWLSTVLTGHVISSLVVASCATALLVGLVTRQSWFRLAYTAYVVGATAWAFAWATIVSHIARANDVALQVSELIGPSTILGMLVSLACVAYVNFSVRIRVTCESMVLPPSAEPPPLR